MPTTTFVATKAAESLVLLGAPFIVQTGGSIQTLNLVQDACFVFAGLVGLGYFYFWLQGYGPSARTSGSYPNAGGDALDDDDVSGEKVGSRRDEHTFNIDGTPMMGFLDLNGNPYGFTRSIAAPPCFADSDWEMHFHSDL